MNKKRVQGFTLIELLVATAIFAIMSVMAYGGLSAVMYAREGLDASYKRSEQWQRAIHRLRMDLDQSRERGIRDEFGTYQPAMHEPENNRLEFTRGGRKNPLLRPRSSLERVSYFLDQGKLIRLNWINLDRGQTEQPIRTEMLKNIEQLEWKYLDDNDEWQEAWPPLSYAGPAHQAPRPRAVELQMDSKQMGPMRFLFFVRDK